MNDDTRPLRMTPKRLRIMRAAEATNRGVDGHSVTFEQQYRRSGGITIYRLLEPGVDGYTLVSDVIGPLFEAALLRTEHASWRFGIGHVYLTEVGRRRLAAAEAGR